MSIFTVLEAFSCFYTLRVFLLSYCVIELAIELPWVNIDGFGVISILYKLGSHEEFVIPSFMGLGCSGSGC